MKTNQINNKHYQECDVIMLSSKTKKLGDMQPWLHGDKLRSLTGEHSVSKEEIDTGYCVPQHLYILSNEKPKEGEWYITKVVDSNGEKHIIGQRLDKSDSDYSNCKKIIATTDVHLDKYWVLSTQGGGKCEFNPKIAEIPQSFIEYFISEYNKGNTINKVLVECYITHETDYDKFLNFKLNQSNEISILTEQKQSYSFNIDELSDLLNTFATYTLVNSDEDSRLSTVDWIKQNLK